MLTHIRKNVCDIQLVSENRTPFKDRTLFVWNTDEQRLEVLYKTELVFVLNGFWKKQAFRQIYYLDVRFLEIYCNKDSRLFSCA